MPNKDVNDFLKSWQEKDVPPADQAAQVQKWLGGAEPFVIYRAREIGKLTNINEKTEALNEYFKNIVAVLPPDDRAGLKDEICDAAGIKSTQWTDRLKNLNGHVKKNKD